MPQGVQLYEGMWASTGGSMASPAVTMKTDSVTLHVAMAQAMAARKNLQLVFSFAEKEAEKEAVIENPLEKFTPEQLYAELVRRGFRIN